MRSGHRAALRSGIFVALAAVAIGLGACGSGDAAPAAPPGAPKGGAIAGAGALLPGPVYAEWAARYKDATGTSVRYTSDPALGDVAALSHGRADFGATDLPLTSRERLTVRSRGAPVQVPTVMNAVVVAYHVPGVGTGLKLDGLTLANMFLGRVSRWDDPAIIHQNPGTALPPTAIRICHRADAAAATQLFTGFLSQSSRAWGRDIGSDRLVDWPGGVAVMGTRAVASCIRSRQGGVGFVEQPYAQASHLSLAAVRNRSGNYVDPSLESVTAAAQGPRSSFGYPIATPTFIVVYQDLCRAGLDPHAARRVLGFLQYAEGDGQQVAPQVSYAPLPTNVNAAAKRKVAALRCNGRPLVG